MKIQREPLSLKKVYLILILLVTVNLISYGCQKKMTHQDRVNVISSGMDVFQKDVRILIHSINDAHDAGTFKGAKYEKARDIIVKVAPIVFKLEDNWKLVPQTDAGIEAFILSPDFQSGLALALQLADILKENDIHVELTKLLSKNILGN